jgi:hypothetical protein
MIITYCCGGVIDSDLVPSTGTFRMEMSMLKKNMWFIKARGV